MDNINEQIKLEIITELGLIEKVKKFGWKSLTAKETGRVGGLITKRKKMAEMVKLQQNQQNQQSQQI